MYHFFAQHENIHQEYIDIVGSDVNHLKNVLRLTVGDNILISSGDNVDYTCCISQIDNDYVRADIIQTDCVGRELPVKVYLFQGLPKSDKMELIIQKAVELGACEIIPVASARCIVKLDGKKEASKTKRWQGIAESAAKQSKRGKIPVVSRVMSMKEAVEYGKTFEMVLVPYELANGMDVSKQQIKKAGKSYYRLFLNNIF